MDMAKDKDISLSRDEVADPQVIEANDHAAEVAEALAESAPAPVSLARPPVAQVSVACASIVSTLCALVGSGWPGVTGAASG